MLKIYNYNNSNISGLVDIIGKKQVKIFHSTS
jgi:hypothetical protein